MRTANCCQSCGWLNRDTSHFDIKPLSFGTRIDMHLALMSLPNFIVPVLPAPNVCILSPVIPRGVLIHPPSHPKSLDGWDIFRHHKLLWASLEISWPKKNNGTSHHQSSSIMITYHQSSSIIVNHHHLSSIIVNHQSSWITKHQSSIISLHQSSSPSSLSSSSSSSEYHSVAVNLVWICPNVANHVKSQRFPNKNPVRHGAEAPQFEAKQPIASIELVLSHLPETRQRIHQVLYPINLPVIHRGTAGDCPTAPWQAATCRPSGAKATDHSSCGCRATCSGVWGDPWGGHVDFTWDNMESNWVY